MVSRRFKSIFVHIPKTGGQSIENAFFEIEDATREELLIRENNDPDLGPPYLMHLMAKDYLKKNYVTKSQFSDYFKFSFVRNPWSRMVSFYKYYNYCRRYDFKTYLLKHFEKRDWKERYWCFAPQYEFLFDEIGNQLVDFIGKFERLNEDFELIRKKIGFPKTDLKHVNKSRPTDMIPLYFSNPKSLVINSLRNVIRIVYKERIMANLYSNYRDYYDDESIEFVRRRYAKDVECFNYTFNEG